MRHYLDHNAPVREGAQNQPSGEGAQTKTGRPSVFCCLYAGGATR